MFTPTNSFHRSSWPTAHQKPFCAHTFPDTAEAPRRYTNLNTNTDIYRDDPFTPPTNRHSTAYPPSPSTFGTNNANEANHKKPIQVNKGDMVHMPALGTDWAPDEARADKEWDGKPTVIDKHKWNNRKHEIADRQSKLGHSVRAWFVGDKKLGGWFGRLHGIALSIVLIIAFVVPSFFFFFRSVASQYQYKYNVSSKLFVGPWPCNSFLTLFFF